MSKQSDYTAKKISTNITVDGNIKKDVWLNANWSTRFVDMVTGQPGIYNTQTAIVCGYFTQSLPAFQRKVYHPKGGVEAFSNLVNFFGS